MYGRITRTWFAVFVVAAFVVGVLASATITRAIGFDLALGLQSQGPKSEAVEIEKFSSGINDELKKLNSEIDEIKSRPNGQQEISDEIANLEKQLQLMEMRINKLGDLSEEIDELKKEIRSIKSSSVSSTPTVPSPMLQSLSVSLDRFEYKAGESILVSGVGLPNKSIKVTLLNANRVTISEGSTVSDSSGRFSFVVQLSKNLSDGNYSVQITQDSSVVEKQFRLSPSLIQTGGSSLTTNSREYLRGENVVLSGVTDPDTWVDIDIFDSNDAQIVRTSTRSDASGKYRLDYLIPSNASTGEYEVKATVGTKSASVKFYVVQSKSSSASGSSSQVSGRLTVTTDKSSYNKGNFVTVMGTAVPNAKVTIYVDPPLGDNMILTTNPDASGNYRTLFEIRSDAATGTWKITAEQRPDSATANITVI